jgi:hypothetical protein
MLCCDNAVIVFKHFHRWQLQEIYVTQFKGKMCTKGIKEQENEDTKSINLR